MAAPNDNPDKDADQTDRPLTTEDLYGTGSGKENLVYEETPIIEPATDDEVPVHEDLLPQPPKPPPPRPPAKQAGETGTQTYVIPVQGRGGNAGLNQYKPSSRPSSLAFNIIFFILLFSLGVLASMFLRSYLSDFEMPAIKLPSFSRSVTPTPTQSVPQELPAQLTPTGESAAPPVNAVPSSGAGSQITYNVISGKTKSPSGVSIDIPGQTKTPVCDSSACASQGADLPGGTRFTVALRGQGQLLPDPRGKILTDARGHEFVIRDVTAGSYQGLEFTADFTGSTGGGFAFTKMRGVMVYISDSLTLELSHYAPAQRVSDFAKDDEIFNRILSSVRVK